MGFLDHSTNNIVVDAVLTDIGRQALAKNDGSFSIYQFALGDDEIDYGIVQQFGRTVGKEKIEKNTPVMEALTVGSLGLKHPLVSISNEFLTHMPTLTLTAKTNPITFDRKSNISINTLNIEIVSQAGTTIEYDLLDPEVLVEINHQFLSIVGESPDIRYTDNIAVYRMSTSQSSTGSSISAKIPLRIKSFATSTFNTYSVAGSSHIRTYVKVTGINSGLTKTIEVNIS
tara:strand:+ start:575 stop:1261 length:687 start_codon:yes stop_codon:yes gene_type:complete